MNYVIFDDKKWENFFPITLTRSTGDLRVGILKLRQRIIAYLEKEITNIVVHPLLQKIYKERHPEWIINNLASKDTIFINSRLKINNELVEAISNLDENCCLVYKSEILAARFLPSKGKYSSEDLPELFKDLDKVKWEKEACWNYIWELISENSKYIEKDFQNFFYEKDNYFEAEQGVTLLNPYNIWLGENSKIAPGVVLDATEGPIIVDENAKIMPNAVIIGPVYVGKNSTIKVGAKIYEGTSIGPVCKVGGEVEESIFQAFSNKQHDGFLGHSYLGEWVNIGADTNNSDLKNTYSEVEMYFYPKIKKIKTGCQFLGCLIGDHSKTGINCTINTGTSIGAGCNLIGSELFMNYIPSFHWGKASVLVENEKAKFDETAKLVKERRNLEYTKAEKELYSNLRKIVLE
ncbi:MAG: hypothetical protein K9N09_00475 [Candidatus Cloacimonetes bacterium]|nr:hypothetical protein [Candidatus Cloacimonadota bacterium]MCF7812936.1 hypothetical protein [Candidatus Cloacimonadota bacterium]MCF7867148.1 hypothetical protein [Candidatus Cloacimonadota bacterium]MCF7882532.1 hypothetical protein [Candidatus Cloacimonadota bacterium]